MVAVADVGTHEFQSRELFPQDDRALPNLLNNQSRLYKESGIATAHFLALSKSRIIDLNLELKAGYSNSVTWSVILMCFYCSIER